MNGKEMMNLPQLKEVLLLKAGEKGLNRQIRWIYFADCLQCVKSEYRMEDYIHGGEFVVLTNRSVTDDREKLMALITKMQEHDISALGINEGQISEELLIYCEEKQLPLFELPEKFALIDLSQIVCQKLVLEQTSQNSAQQLFLAILDAEHFNKEKVLSQAEQLGIHLSGKFAVVEFAFEKLELGEQIRHAIEREVAFYLPEKLLFLLQTGSVLALLPEERLKDFKMVLKEIVQKVQRNYDRSLRAGVGNAFEYLEEIRLSRKQAAVALKIAAGCELKDSVFFYKDQGLYTFISQISDGRYLDDFVENQLGKLIRADSVNGGNLFETLECYLNHNCNGKATAEAMFLHRNTLNYRLNKIRELLDNPMDDLDNYLMLKLAFCIWNYRNWKKK